MVHIKQAKIPAADALEISDVVEIYQALRPFMPKGRMGKARPESRLIDLLDEYIPVVKGSEINDSPFRPISKYSQGLLNEYGDNTPISWVHRSERYYEKLATPDVNVSDLIGDIDPIKAATLKLEYSR